MRAAVLFDRGGPPQLIEFDAPQASPGHELIDVRTAGLGGWDIVGAYQFAVDYPCVIRGEGVGIARDGRRVYFGERSVPPFGAWAEQTLVPSAEVWDVPSDVDDRLAITMAIAGTGAFAPLEQARIQPGESVLVLGATGTLGQIALQLARRHFGAGLVIGAGRSKESLARLLDRDIADAVVQMGTAEEVAALKAASGGRGFDVVLDIVYGQPFLAALKATRWGARIMTIGIQAGRTATIAAGDMVFRTHSVVGTGQRAPEDRRALWQQLLSIARKQSIDVDYKNFTFEQAAAAWQEQVAIPHAKITATIDASH